MDDKKNDGRLPPKTIIERSTSAWAVRDQWKSLLQDAYELVLPTRNPYSTTSDRPKPMDRAFDSTATNSVFRAANRMLMDVTPPDQDWADFVPGPLMTIQLDKSQIEQIEKQLEDVAKIVSLVFQTGSFVNSIWECYLDLLVSGLAALAMIEDPADDTEPIIFEAVSQAKIAIDETAGGKIDMIHMNEKIAARKILSKWDDAELPAELEKLAQDGKDTEVELKICAYRKPKKEGPGWYYDVIWDQKDAPERIVGRAYENAPIIVFRWSKIPGDRYGPGPVLMALADIRTANKVMQMIMMNAALALAGMYLVNDNEVINTGTLQITNGGMIPVTSTGGSMGASIVPLETGRAFDVGQILLEDLRENIKKALFDSQLPPLNGDIRSATEIIERQKDLALDIGGAMGRLNAELIVPLVRGVVGVMKRRGYIPNINIDQFSLKVQVNTPLARAQHFRDVETVTQWVSMVGGLFGEEIKHLSAKSEDIPAWMGQQVGVPTGLVRTENEREAMQQQVAQIMAAQQSAAAQQQTMTQQA